VCLIPPPTTGPALWDLFANELFAVADSTAPLFATVGIALGALVLANVVAVLPARRAAKTSASEVLRSE
jgi:hypothetical protein